MAELPVDEGSGSSTRSVPTTPLPSPVPVVLRGHGLRMEPLAEHHVAPLQQVVADGEIWRLPYAPHVPAPEALPAAVRGLREDVAAGTRIAWVVVREADGRALGLTTFMNLALADRGLEIGNTYLAGSAQRTGVNPAMKRLLLGHAFDELGCLRVEFRVHHLNIASRRAVERLGAQQDGILRAHRILPDGSVRHTVVYSILAPEWPGIRAALDHRLGI
ncbi:GNAT family N-acetyltransferase [Brachybacterium sp. AOP43-C2-M15]|uniref:GNAT family N-acetyltransferase n=1 Tax=Brachybacterium sp. AOP43-C2-M15 TaxID=3457661 RepID=UPI0040339CD5